MRRLFWLIVLVGGYFWVLTSGKDQFLLQKAKAAYEFATKWLEDADADFQLNSPKSKKKSRRWD